MNDLDKIKELVATCDSTSIELAIALGVNMEGYKRHILHGCICENLFPIIEKEHMEYCINAKRVFDLPTVYNVNIEFKKLSTLSAFKITDRFVRDCIDSYLSL